MQRDVHLAAGLPWAGNAVKQGAVVWVAAESGDDIYRRMEALKQRYELKDDLPFFPIVCPVNLRDPKADVRPLIETIKRIELEYGVKVRKVTVDTLSRALAGRDENSSADMGVLVKNLDAVRFETGATVEIIHHCGKDAARGARGHSLLRGAIDAGFEITPGRIEADKQRSMRDDGVWIFKLPTIQLGKSEDGRDLTTCYADIRPKNASGFDPADFRIELTGSEKAIFDVLKERLQTLANETGRPYSEIPFDWKLVSECVRSLGKSAGKGDTRSSVQRLLTALSEKGRVKKFGRGQWVIVDCPECPE
jgi:AAA domain